MARANRRSKNKTIHANERAAAYRENGSRCPTRPSPLSIAVALALGAGNIYAPAVHAQSAALPAGGQVTAGSATISQSAANALLIRQQSDRAAINWQSFSIGAGNRVDFVQPSASSIALNRVIGNSRSEIYGSLSANGQVFLVNPNGLLFAPGAQVDVGGLVASTLNISDRNFLDGRLEFSSPDSTASVINRGSITVRNGGTLALIGNQVINEGNLYAHRGSVVLGAGGSAQLTLNDNRLIRFEVTQGALNALAENGGLIRANGGNIILTAGARDSLLRSVVNNSGVIEAQTVERQSGSILLLAGMAAGSTQVGGTLDASAPAALNPNGGDGGFIETSAAHVQVRNDARISTRADQGRTGQWLIDPTDYTIAASGGDISGSTLSANLASTSVSILSSGGGTAGNGDIHVNDDVNWSANTLTLTAARDININAVMTASGSSALVMNTGSANGADAGVAGGRVNVGLNTNNTFRGRVDFGARSGSGFLTINNENYTVINSLGAQGSTTGADLQGMQGNLAGRFALGADIDASATAGWNAGTGFRPVGPDTRALAFAGRFNGLGHVVSNLTIKDTPSHNFLGLFGVTTGSVANLGLSGVTIGSTTALNSIGSIAGYLSGVGSSLSNSFVTGTVTGSRRSIGGLVGDVDGTVSNSQSSATVTGNPATSTSSVGGLVGANTGIIEGSVATGSVSGRTSVGGLAGANSATVRNSHATGAVTGTGASVGGLLGNNGGTVSNSYATGNVSGVDDVGGLIGRSTDSVAESYATGNVTASGVNAGGLTGSMGGSPSQQITYSYATGDVTGFQQVGGLVGLNSASTIANSHASGNITATGLFSVGGLVGVNNSGGTINSSYATGTVTANAAGQGAGGLIGSNTGEIFYSFASGAVNAPNFSQVGGLVGAHSASYSIEESYAVGAVTGNRDTGGLVGINVGRIVHTYSTGNVTGNFNVGGLIGSHASLIPVDGSYWNTQTSGQASSAGGAGVTGLTTAQMQQAASFTGWSVSDTGYQFGSTAWRIYENQTAPLLRRFLQPMLIVPRFDGTAQIWNDITAYDTNISNPDPSLIIGTNRALTLSSTASLELLEAKLTGISSTQLGYDIQFGSTFLTSPGNPVNRIDLATPINWNAGRLILSTPGDINLNAVLTPGGTATLAMNAGSGLVRTGFNPDGSFKGRVDFGSRTGNGLLSINGENYTVINSLGAQGSTTGTDLQGMGGNVTGRYALGADIDASATAGWNAGNGFSPITGFTGKLNGLGHVIDNLNILDTGTHADLGLIGTAQNAAIANIGLTNAVIGNGSGIDQLGILAGYMSNGSIHNSFATGSVNGRNVVGGLVGFIDSSAAISGSRASAQVSGFSFVGGLVAANQDGRIEFSSSAGTVNGNNNVGGLVGGNVGFSIISNSHSTANVFATAQGGGLVGSNGGNIRASYATGDVQGSVVLGGLIGENTGSVDISYAAGGINGQIIVGGLIGYQSGSVTDSYATGPVNGGSLMGGLTATNAGTIVRSYSTGLVNGGFPSTSTGGLIGDNALGTVTGSFWDTQTSGQSSSAGGTGLTTAQMKQRADFSTAGWDIANTGGSASVWRIYEGRTTPLLSGLLTPLTITADNVTRTYDATATGLTNVSYSDASASGSSHLFGVATPYGAVSKNNVGSYTADLWSNQLGYDITLVGGNLTVTPAPLGVTGITAANKVYDGNRGATLLTASAAFSGLLGSDDVTLDTTLLSASFNSKDVDNNRPVSFTGLTIAGADAGNYQFSAPTGLTANITRKTITYSTTAANKVYDGNTSATATLGSLNGLVGSETLTISNSASFNSKDVASANLVTVDSITLTDGLNGGLAGNYSMAAGGNAAAQITAKTITYTTSAADKIYDGNRVATATLTGLTGLVGAETLTISNNASFNSKDVVTANRVTIDSITLADGSNGGLAGNYSISAGGTAAARITPRPATVTADSLSKTAGSSITFAGTEFSVSGMAGSESISRVDLASAGAAANASVNGSPYAITATNATGSGFDRNNYLLRYVDGRLTVNNPPVGSDTSPQIRGAVHDAQKDRTSQTPQIPQSGSNASGNSGGNNGKQLFNIVDAGMGLPEGL